MVKGERTLYLYLLGLVLNSIKLLPLTAGTFQLSGVVNQSRLFSLASLPSKSCE